MAGLHLLWFVSSCLLIHQVLSIQVTPNSPCAKFCLDNPNSNASDPNNSNTHGSDIVCSDSDYTNNAVGQKFEACVNCLQNSTAEADRERDQWWFLYNMRFAFDSCVFGFENASTPLNTPCSIDSSCGHLQQALEDGNLQGTGYGYCSANNNAFLGAFHDICFNCLKTSGDHNYLANFLTALQGGCLQQPYSGYIVGLDGSVFESQSVNITYPINGNPSSGQTKKGLSRGAIIAVAIGTGTLLIITIGILSFCHRKNRGARRIRKLQSPLDPRFGATNITAPTDGAYGNPYSNIAVSQPFNRSELSAKQRYVMGLEAPIPGENSSQAPPSKWEDPGHHRNNRLPPYSPPNMPTHQAYIPDTIPVSPTTTISSEPDDADNSYQMSSYSNNTTPRVSPAYIPPKKLTPAPIQLLPLPGPSPSSWRPRASPYTPPSSSTPPDFSHSSHPTPTLHSIKKGPVPANLGPSSIRTNTSPTLVYSPPLPSSHSHRSTVSKAESAASRITRRLGLTNTNTNTNTNDPNTPTPRSDPELAHAQRRLRASHAQYSQQETSPAAENAAEQWPGSY